MHRILGPKYKRIIKSAKSNSQQLDRFDLELKGQQHFQANVPNPYFPVQEIRLNPTSKRQKKKENIINQDNQLIPDSPFDQKIQNPSIKEQTSINEIARKSQKDLMTQTQIISDEQTKQIKNKSKRSETNNFRTHVPYYFRRFLEEQTNAQKMKKLQNQNPQLYEQFVQKLSAKLQTLGDIFRANLFTRQQYQFIFLDKFPAYFRESRVKDIKNQFIGMCKVLFSEFQRCSELNKLVNPSGWKQQEVDKNNNACFPKLIILIMNKQNLLQKLSYHKLLTLEYLNYLVRTYILSQQNGLSKFIKLLKTQEKQLKQLKTLIKNKQSDSIWPKDYYTFIRHIRFTIKNFDGMIYGKNLNKSIIQIIKLLQTFTNKELFGEDFDQSSIGKQQILSLRSKKIKDIQVDIKEKRYLVLKEIFQSCTAKYQSKFKVYINKQKFNQKITISTTVQRQDGESIKTFQMKKDVQILVGQKENCLRFSQREYN